MKTISHWMKALLVLCLIALVSSCNDVKQENQVAPDQNRAELEAIAKQYGLKLSALDPTAKNVIWVASVQALRDTLDKYCGPSALKARQALHEAFAKSLLAEHLGSNYSPEERARFDKWNANRVAQLLASNQGKPGYSVQLQGPGTTPICHICPNWPWEDPNYTPPSQGGGPSPTPPTPSPGSGSGPTDPGGHGGPGGVSPNDPGDVAVFNLGDTSPGGRNGGKSTSASVPLLGGTFTPLLSIDFDYKLVHVGSRDNGRNVVAGANIAVSASGVLGNQVKAIPYGNTGYTDANGNFYVTVLLNYTYTPTAGIGAYGVNLSPTTNRVSITFYIYPDGSTSYPIVKSQ